MTDRTSSMDRAAFDAVIFEMDGVVTDTATIHAAAWKALFDEALPGLTERHAFGPVEARVFDLDADYRRYVDGRTREDGVRSFLTSRGITLPQTGASSVESLAAGKQHFFDQVIEADGVQPFVDAVAMLKKLQRDGVPIALVTSSRNSTRILAAAGLDGIFVVCVDGNDTSALGLPGKPDPAMFLEAAQRLGIPPRRIALLEGAEAGVKAGMDGGFGLVVGVARDGRGDQLLAAGADLAVTTLDALSLSVPRPRGSAAGSSGKDPWVLRYSGYDAASEGHREALCTVGNGYWATRGAAPESSAGDVHYPGTYLAGVYNRLRTELADRTVEDEHLVNAPNWLPFAFRVADGNWFDPADDAVIEYIQELDLRRGLLSRFVRIRDDAGRITAVTSQRFVSQSEQHLACLQTTFEAENWSGEITVRSALDGRVANRNVSEYTQLADTHLLPLTSDTIDDETLLLESETSQSHVRIAMAARTRVHAGGEQVRTVRRVVSEPGYVAHEFTVAAESGRPVTVEKVVMVATSRDRAIASPAHAVTTWIARLPDVDALQASHVNAWEELWRDFAVEIDGPPRQALALNLNTFHVLQTVAAADPDLDAGVPARGLHGEGYKGHIFWDEMFVYPIVTMRRPDLSRNLLGYRYRRLPEAKAAARQAGFEGAMFPWQSGIDGREETPTQLYNLRNERWMPDNSHHQRHVGLAIAYGVWEYYETSGDRNFLLERGLELLVEVCRFFASLAVHDDETGRYDIHGVMGPDEFHDAYPGASGPGLRNNAYTNILASWVMRRAVDAVELVRSHSYHPVWARLGLQLDELERWERVSRGLKVPFHADGVISQFDGYEQLQELDWCEYRKRYSRIGRMDLILHAEGDTTNKYRLSKQADVLMLLYLFSASVLREIVRHMGYELTEEAIESTVRFYSERSTHGSTLSNLVHSWVEARQDRTRSWHFLTEALDSDLADIQGGTTREGVHLGAMAGSIDMVVRCYTGLVFREDALWFDPVLPEELTRVDFTINYRRQPIRVELSSSRLRLTLAASEAGPVVVHTPNETIELSAGDTHEFVLSGQGVVPEDAGPRPGTAHV